jgi:hypothetical protein
MMRINFQLAMESHRVLQIITDRPLNTEYSAQMKMQNAVNLSDLKARKPENPKT